MAARAQQGGLPQTLLEVRSGDGNPVVAGLLSCDASRGMLNRRYNLCPATQRSAWRLVERTAAHPRFADLYMLPSYEDGWHREFRCSAPSA